MGAYRGLEEALFFALISTNFLQNLSKFCAGDAPKRVKTFEQPFTRVPKIYPPPRPPHGSLKSPTISLKKFQYFLRRLYKVHTEALPRVQNARECTANSAVNPVVDPAMDSVVHLRRIWRRIPSARLVSTFKRPTKFCHAKQLQARMHVDANIHS